MTYRTCHYLVFDSVQVVLSPLFNFLRVFVLCILSFVLLFVVYVFDDIFCMHYNSLQISQASAVSYAYWNIYT